jgi:hypothetical protein
LCWSRRATSPHCLHPQAVCLSGSFGVLGPLRIRPCELRAGPPPPVWHPQCSWGRIRVVLCGALTQAQRSAFRSRPHAGYGCAGGCGLGPCAWWGESLPLPPNTRDSGQVQCSLEWAPPSSNTRSSSSCASRRVLAVIVPLGIHSAALLHASDLSSRYCAMAGLPRDLGLVGAVGVLAVVGLSISQVGLMG